MTDVLPQRAPRMGRAAATLQTLVRLRWLVLVAQVAATEIAQRGLGLSVPVWPVYALLAISAISNIGVLFLRRAPAALGEGEAAAILLFDTAVVALLLLLTGGTANPAAAAILVPPVIAAAATASGAGLLPALLAVVALAAMPFAAMRLAPATPPAFAIAHAATLGTALTLMVVYLRRVALEAQTAAHGLMAARDALERERRVTDLTALAAAAAHELSSPLGTIKIAASELAGDLPEGAAREDARLIAKEADRCGALLRSLGGSREGLSDPILARAPLSTLLEDAAGPHAARGRRVIYDVPADLDRTLRVPRGPEVVHGLRNVVQNAVDHARSEVRISGRRDRAGGLRVVVSDDGPGFPPHLFDRLGEPLEDSRHGMGMGLFIARTLLERTGARMRFGDARDERGTGAIVEIAWPRDALVPSGGAVQHD